MHAVYDEMPDVLDEPDIPGVDGVLFDLGVSSLQLDVAERGFAYSRDAPLDMRMDPTTGPTAADVLNSYPDADLARILREYGEERFAGRIAKAIVASAPSEPFTTTAAAGGAAARRRSRPRPAAHRRPPGQAHLPGAAHRGQRRAGRAARGRCPPP